jgi:hypothetical protein
MGKKLDLSQNLTFGFEQTFTIDDWWTEPGFTHESDTPKKREAMLALANALDKVQGGKHIESKDIWGHLQYETFKKDGTPSFIVTMDPGSIEVKTQPVNAKDAQKMAKPLFEASKIAKVVPYRNWWYGIQGATEGGCHINMGGLQVESNPFFHDPFLLVKYCAYIHNRPWLHYPFMGPDVGPGGNAMRLDERDDFEHTKDLFKSYQECGPEETREHFSGCSLVKHKDSFPCLKKFEAPLYLIEDRAQEAMREALDFELVCEMRLKILEKLQMQNQLEELKSFDHLHTQFLTSFYLWECFHDWSLELQIDSTPYQRFFDRQFPRLLTGAQVASKFGIKEGRRPRKIKDEVIVDGVARSKTIDTRYKRLELFHRAESEKDEIRFNIQLEGLEVQSDLYFSKQEKIFYQYIDLILDQDKSHPYD